MGIRTTIRRFFVYDPENIRSDRMHALYHRQRFAIKYEIIYGLLPKMSRKDQIDLACQRVAEHDDYFARLDMIEIAFREQATPEELRLADARLDHDNKRVAR